MKKAKIMLLTIMAVAIAGGILAFKAKRFAHMNVYCATMTGSQIICLASAFKTVVNPNPITNPFVTTPCETWHNALGFGASRTSSFYTSTTCPPPLRASVTSTTNQ